MLAAEVQADLLILMSDVDGIYNKPPWEDGAKLMHTYTSDDSNSIEFGKKSKAIPDSSPPRRFQLTNLSFPGGHWRHGLKGEGGHLGTGPGR